MARKLWGEFTETKSSDTQPAPKIIPTSAKRAKLEEIQNASLSSEKHITIQVKNPLVTQTIEVMKQTEMLQSLIDTYSQKSGTSNYLLNPCQMIPEIDFPPENAVDFVSDEKFTKPIWFIPPLSTDFARGVPKHYPAVNGEVCRAAFSKAICGQLRVTGFTDTAESALVLFTDAVDEFVRNFMLQIRDVHANDPAREKQNDVEVKTLEKAYMALTNTSLLQVHNYYKHQLIARNRSEISEFKGVLHDYAKLMKESQSMQRDDFQETDYLHILEMQQQQQTGGAAVGAEPQQSQSQSFMTGGNNGGAGLSGMVTSTAAGGSGLSMYDVASTSHHVVNTPQ